ncbi:MAG: ABC-type transport system involved in multi-copper enzyme maturation permease subunit [Cryomorphaceae bacterium]|jgi:ABC-type transport system involved in multi-copper enzyme maturation permease subunit
MISPKYLTSKLTPMVLKELRQGLRRGVFLIPFMLIHLFAVAALYLEFYTEVELGTNPFTGVMQMGLFLENSPFWWVAGGVCMLLMPMGGIVLMGQEMDEGNYELLQMTELSRWQVVLGKFLSIWSISLLTFSSLIPYLIVRYFVGGMEVWRNVALVLTVVLAAAIVAAGAIGASSFKNPFARMGIFLLFLVSLVVSGTMVLMASALRSGGCGVFYHLNVIGLTLCYVMLGLVMARSRIRLVVHQYEVKPSWMMICLLVFTPIVVGMGTLMTGGWMGFIGCVAMTIVARYADVSPKAPKWVKMPELNIPKETKSQDLPNV